MDACGIVRRAMPWRTAKSCGPGAPGLALSLRIGDVGPSGPTRRDPAGDGDYEVTDTGESTKQR